MKGKVDTYMNNFDMNKLMNMISKMDKKELEKGIAQASQMLNAKDKEEIMKKLNNMQNGGMNRNNG